jgi:alpha/beta superfamily hydrolase
VQRTQYQLETNLPERAGFFDVSGAQLYTVLHKVADPVARALLVGPFASERHTSYGPWVRWARYLAEKRIEVLRYDYRGIGESTGVFEEMTFEDWYEDVRLLAEWLKYQTPNVPLMLHGLEIGALLAGKVFQTGIGDALLLWSPSANANQALRLTLLRWVGLEQLLKYTEERKTAADYIRQLEQGSSIEVAGYEWSPRLWNDSFHFEMPSDMDTEDKATQRYERPVRIAALGADAAPLAKKGIVGGGDEIKDFTWLYSHHFNWVSEVLAGVTRT